jgi:hypothetical protein
MNLVITTSLIIAALVESLVFAASLLPSDRNVTQDTFDALEELARLVDIAYCVGSSGVQKPFQCLSRCDDFPGFELVSTWHTGPLLSDSCGYIALSHPPYPKRIIVAFRGTYSIANTVADLSTVPAEYVPYPGDGDSGDDLCATRTEDTGEADHLVESWREPSTNTRAIIESRCEQCTVHSGFMTSWRNARCTVIPHVSKALSAYPDYQVTLVGHSLGGAVAALASLEFQFRGWKPHVTTFGEPRIGNKAMANYIDDRFNLTQRYHPFEHTYRRVTHTSDPVPLLPFEEWGFRAHGGEIFISKHDLPPTVEDLQHCDGDEDPECIAGPRFSENMPQFENGDRLKSRDPWRVPDRYRLWQLFFAHRDYFWHLGMCLPGRGGKWLPADGVGIGTIAEEL